MQIGGFYYDQNGRLVRGSLWWPIKFIAHIVSFFDLLFGGGGLAIRSTAICVARSGNSHTKQPISVFMADAENPTRIMWGVDINFEQAINVAQQLIQVVGESNYIRNRITGLSDDVVERIRDVASADAKQN